MICPLKKIIGCFTNCEVGDENRILCEQVERLLATMTSDFDTKATCLPFVGFLVNWGVVELLQSYNEASEDVKMYRMKDM